jgi:hypothetical protein
MNGHGSRVVMSQTAALIFSSLRGVEVSVNP